MERYLIFARASCTAKALETLLKLTDREVTGTQVAASMDKLRIFAAASAFIQEHLDGGTPLVVLVDSVDLDGLNPCQTGFSWDAAIAMLILAFPEVRWLFGIMEGNRCGLTESLHGLEALAEPGFDPIYDAGGLRRLVRQKTEADGERILAGGCREFVACALDEEGAYAHFHAYTSYRFGYRAVAVETERLAKAILGDLQTRTKGWPANLDLLVEDLYLNYADRLTAGRWSNLVERQRELPGLEPGTGASPLRVFVTTNLKHGTDAERRTNQAERRRLRREGRLGTVVPKPIAGIFDLWHACGLSQKFRHGHGYVEGFEWPPKEGRRQGGVPDRHGAPGALLVIADCLIARANALMGNVNSVKDAVRGAVLATDALELLGDRTPTTALEALSLKHRFEVMAECQFYGVQSHLDVEARIKEIQREIEAIGRYFHPSNKLFACWNAEAMILGDLIAIFDEHGQFDESMVLQACARRMHRRLWARRYMGVFGDGLRWVNPAYLLVTYTHGLLLSLPRFFAVMCLWIAGLGLMYGLCSAETTAPNRWQMAYQDAITSFFSVGSPIHERADATLTPSPSQNLSKNGEILRRLDKIEDKLPTNSEPAYACLVCLSIVAGFFHLGIFISHLYTITARK